jgi:hypothetical protein
MENLPNRSSIISQQSPLNPNSHPYISRSGERLRKNREALVRLGSNFQRGSQVKIPQHERMRQILQAQCNTINTHQMLQVHLPQGVSVEAERGHEGGMEIDVTRGREGGLEAVEGDFTEPPQVPGRF